MAPLLVLMLTSYISRFQCLEAVLPLQLEVPKD